jgi:hypothetical protein
MTVASKHHQTESECRKEKWRKSMAEHSISDKELKRLYERLDEMHKEQEAERAQIKELLGLVKRDRKKTHQQPTVHQRGARKSPATGKEGEARG